MLLPEIADREYNSDFRLMLRYDGSLRVVTNGQASASWTS